MPSRAIFLAVVISSLTFVAGAVAKEKQDSDKFNKELQKDASSIATTIRNEMNKLKAPERFSTFINNFKKDVDDWNEDQSRTVTSYVDFRDLEGIDKDTSRLSEVNPTIDTLFSKSRMSLIKEPNVTTGAAELKKLQTASDQREAEIESLAASRSDLKELRDGYASTEATARKISEKLGDHVGDSAIEIYCLYNGRNFGLSWFDVAENMAPALQDRVSAADAALKRLDDAIAFAKSDRRQYDTVRNAFQQGYSDPGKSPGLDNVQDIRRETTRSSEAAVELANKYRQQADDIRKENARIAGIQRLLGLSKSLADLYGSVSGGSDAKGAAAQTPGSSYSFRYNVLVMPPGKVGSAGQPVVVQPKPR